MTDAPDYATATILTSGCAVSPDAGPQGHYQPDDAPGEAHLADSNFVLGQNYPNPHKGETTVPFTLPINADVRLDLFDDQGRRMASVVRKGRSAGPQNIKLNLVGLGLPAGNYIYQLQVSSRFGTYQRAKQMTIE